MAESLRFRRSGIYTPDMLLQDLQELDSIVASIRADIASGALKGDKGDQGLPGLPGPPGVKGDAGKGGEDGRNGTNGSNGLSLYDNAVLFYGYSGSESEVVEWLIEQAQSGLGNDPDDWGFIDADYGLITQAITATEDYEGINDDSILLIDFEDRMIITEDLSGFIIDEYDRYYTAQENR